MENDKEKKGQQRKVVPTVSNGFDDGTLIELVHDPRQRRTLLAQFNGGRWTLLRHVNIGSDLQLIPFSPENCLPRPQDARFVQTGVFNLWWRPER